MDAPPKQVTVTAIAMMMLCGRFSYSVQAAKLIRFYPVPVSEKSSL